jgi:hypothetical protein
LPATDGRSMTARRFREGEKQLVRRAAALSAECERQEALWARGEAEFDVAAYSVLSNTVRRIIQTLGLKRVPRDVTPAFAVGAPEHDLSQLGAGQLDRLYALLGEAGKGGAEAIRKAAEAYLTVEAKMGRA